MKKLLCNLVLMVLVLSASAQIDENPVDPEANEETRELYRYLRDEVWGKKVLSGCQAEWNYNTNDANRIKEACGKYPKVNVFDFQHFDQPWINYRTATAKQWHDEGGIVSFMWHIHMPLDASADQKDGKQGFYINGDKPCRILPSRCATEGTLENKIFCRKLEGVASLLLYYQNQGLPIIWRPLHEASGRWFWWGQKTAKHTNSSIAICSTTLAKRASTTSSGCGRRKWAMTTGILAINMWTSLPVTDIRRTTQPTSRRLPTSGSYARHTPTR